MTRVLVVGAISLLTFAKQVRDGFRQAGHEAHYIDYRFLQLQRTTLTNKLINRFISWRAGRLKPDLVLVIKGESILPGTISRISAMGIKTALWIMDEPFGEYDPTTKVQNLAEYDCIFSFDKTYLKPMLDAGAKRAVYLPLAVDPAYFKEEIPARQRAPDCDVAFIGTHYPNREAALLAIAKVTNRIKIWGPYWDAKLPPDSPLRPYIQPEKIAGSAANRHFNLAKINLNTYHDQAREGGMNLRVFEILSTKSFLLTQYVKGIEDQFHNGKELVWFKTPQEAAKLAAKYLSDENARKRIMEAGHKRVLEEHTTAHRAKTILREMGI